MNVPLFVYWFTFPEFTAANTSPSLNGAADTVDAALAATIAIAMPANRMLFIGIPDILDGWHIDIQPKLHDAGRHHKDDQ